MASRARLRPFLVLVCVLIEVGLLTSADGVRPAPAPPSATDPGPAQSPPHPTVRLITLRPPSAEKPIVDYELTIPVLTGLGNRDLERHLNADIRAVARAQVAARTAEAKRYDLRSLRLELASRVALLDRHIYSVEMRTIVASETSAHPALDASTRNYWLADGGTVDLLELFDDFGWARVTERSLREQIPDAFDDLEEPLYAHLLDGFVLAERGVRFVAEACQLAPCAAGYQTALVEYSDLRPFIDPAGPLGYRLNSHR